MSPEEVMKMKWKQIEIVDEGRINSKGEKVSWEVACQDDQEQNPAGKRDPSESSERAAPLEAVA